MPKCPKCGEMNPAGVELCKSCGSQIPREENPQTDVAPGGFEVEVLELLRGDKKIEAIKLYREKTAVDLKEAKEAVEALAKKHNLTSSGVGCAGVLSNEYEGILRLFLTLQHTKELPRQGLILAGFKRHEVDTVAGHSYTVAVLSYLLAAYLKCKYESVDPAEVLKMAIFHDIDEALTGDVGRYVKREAREAWERVEKLAIDKLSKSVEDSVGQTVSEIVNSYSHRTIQSAWIVKVADALDATAQSNSSVWARKKAPVGLNENDKNVSADLLGAALEAEAKGYSESAALLLELRSFFEIACSVIREESVSCIRF